MRMIFPSCEPHHIDATSGEDDVGEGPVFGQATATTAAALDPKRPETWGKVARTNPVPADQERNSSIAIGAFA